MSSDDTDHYLAGVDRPWPFLALSAIVDAIRTGGPFDEAIKWGHPYFSLDGRGVVKLYAARDWINVFYYRGADLSDPGGALSGAGTSAMRRLRVHRGDPDSPVDAIRQLAREAARLTRNY